MTGEILVLQEENSNDHLFCDGRTLNISDYQALFDKIGTKYGGNGTTTFMIPAFGMVDSMYGFYIAH